MGQFHAPRLVIAGTGGDSGKTLAALGVIRALRREGVAVQPFKKGPDYIDPAWLTLAADRKSRNLDVFLMGEAFVRGSFQAYAVASGLNVIEGNRGLYDGEDERGSYSTAELAKLLDAPVLLVLPIVKVTRTAAAVVLGMKALDPGLKLAGVILNQSAGSRHEGVAKKAIEETTGIPVIGSIPQVRDIPLAGRHLGLVTPEEHQSAETAIEAAADLIAKSVDLTALRRIADEASDPGWEESPSIARPKRDGALRDPIRIGWFTGPAFTFYYPENLEALKDRGARLIAIDPLAEKILPDLDALYIGGGFPETHAGLLAGNGSLKEDVRLRVEAGLPVWAECGGLMFLSRAIHWKGQRFEMAGVFSVDTVVEERPQGHGYSEIVAARRNPFLPVGARFKGHEFHYSKIIPKSAPDTIFEMTRGVGIGGKRDGLIYKNAVGLYTHLFAGAAPEWADGLINAATENHRKQTSASI